MWEDKLEAGLDSMLRSLQSNPCSSDKWIWSEDAVDSYTGNSRYKMLLDDRMYVLRDEILLNSLQLLWINSVPSKVLIFTWRLLRERLQRWMLCEREG